MTQTEALSILKMGGNVFLTGEPGSGKTHTINQYVTYLRSHLIEPAITASTGIAATHIGGLTIHSWSGIGIKTYLNKADLAMIVDNPRVSDRIKRTEVLIIDEISMLSAETFTAVEKVCRTVRESSLPFGGIQIVLVGDFFQLPPIQRQRTLPENQELFQDSDEMSSPFAFSSPAWKELDLTVCYLLEQHRQEDKVFINALTAIRRNEVTEDTRECFTSRIISSLPSQSITKLFPHNQDVDRLNEIELNKLPSQPRTFAMRSRGAALLIESLKRNCLSPEALILKIGAKVMFTKNNPEGKFVNGTLGEVIGFDKETGDPIIKTTKGKTLTVELTDWAIQDDTKTLAAISQYPLRLAWAITVHKSQGMSLDAAVIDLRNSFEYGQGYVALSRVRTLDGLYLLGFNTRSLEVHPIVAEQDSRFRDMSAAAVKQLRTINPKTLETRQHDFLIACGGDLEVNPVKTQTKFSTFSITKQMLLGERLTIKEIAKKRGMTTGTIISHLEKLVTESQLDPERDLISIKLSSERFEPIKKALDIVYKKEGDRYLSQTREILGDNFSFDEIRLVRLFL